MENSNIIVHKKRDVPFTMVWNDIWDARLSWKAKAILGYLIGKPQGWRIRVGDLIKRSTDGETSVRSGLIELRMAGYALLEYIRDANNRLNGSVLKVSDEPMFINRPENQALRIRVFRVSENPELGKPGTRKTRNPENRKHSNKDVVDSSMPYQEAGASASRGEASSPSPLPKGAARRTGAVNSKPTSSVMPPADAVGEDEDFELQENGKALLNLWNEYYPKVFKRSYRHTKDDLVALQYLAEEASGYEMMGFILSAWSFKRKPEGEFDPYFYCTRYSSRPRDMWMTSGKDGISNLDKMRREQSWRSRPEQIEFGYKWFEKTQGKQAAPAGS